MYRPVSNPGIHELVSSVYSENWTSSVRKLEQTVAVSEAQDICELLLSSAGWRERVVAAKMIAAFNLIHLVAPLIATFKDKPEFHTAQAFAKLVTIIASPDLRHQLLDELRAACPDTPYGRNMVKIIDSASANAQDDRMPDAGQWNTSR